MRLKSLVARSSCVLAATLLALVSALPATADEVPAQGSFTFTTGPGILPAWSSAGISQGCLPGSVITNTSRIRLAESCHWSPSRDSQCRRRWFSLPQHGNGESFRCSNPTIDIARVIDCVLPFGYNSTVFAITDINARAKADTESTKTTIFQGMRIQIINREMANRLNQELDTNVFSSSVTMAQGSLVVTRDR